MAGLFFISIALFLFVIYRICNRAYMAYTRGYKTWPILALLAVLYIIFGVVRRFTGMDTNTFLIGSFVCIIASQLIFRSSANTGSGY